MPVSNHRGPIADSYDQLQGIAELEKARARFPLLAGSIDSVNRTLLQAAEIAMLNVGDLLRRATGDVQAGAAATASEKLSWIIGFHRILVELSLTPHVVAALEPETPGASLSVTASPAYATIKGDVAAFDEVVIETLGERLETALENPAADPNVAALAHLARIASHESAMWERNLQAVPVWHMPAQYAEYIAADLLQEAVYGFSLDGDTFFMQFRALHQISELAAMECCQQVRTATQGIQSGAPLDAIRQLLAANSLLHTMIASLRPMADNLTTAAYHEIRENLGMTSGSHSDAIRRQLFQESYAELAKTAIAQKHLVSKEPESQILTAELFRMRSYIGLWRDLHLHLARNNLGGRPPVPTRSLIGSPDAVAAVQQMQADALRRDPLREAAAMRGLESQPSPALLSTIARLDNSLDQYLIECTGRITQRRFPQVQERTGYFSKQAHLPPQPEE